MHRCSRVFAIAAGLATGTLTVQAARADVVHIVDGSRIIGTIGRLQGGKLAIDTKFAGIIHIELSRIESLESDNPLNIALESGDRLVGNVSRTAERSYVVNTAQGPVPLRFETLTGVWPVGEKSPEALEAERVQEALWTGSVEAGVRREEGNKDTLNVRGGFELLRKTDEDQLLFYVAAKMSEQNGARSTNEYRGGIHYENNASERWFWYTRIDLEFDEFENLDLRSEAAAGGGYYWLKKPDHELKTRAGAGYRHESFDNGVSSDQSYLDLGLDYRIDLCAWAQLKQTTTYSPSFEEYNDYRLVFDTAMFFPLAGGDVWKLKLGVRNEYDSMPQPGIDRLDNTYYANIVYTFK